MSMLLQPTTLGNCIPLRNHICSMTRNRCMDDNKPTQSTITHYAESARDGTGLIVAEGTFTAVNGSEWPHYPLMFDRSHAQSWKEVTDAVHREGGKILFQPWHPGEFGPIVFSRSGIGLTDTTGLIQNENMPMVKNTRYKVLAPSKIKAKGGKFRTLEGSPVSISPM